MNYVSFRSCKNRPEVITEEVKDTKLKFMVKPMFGDWNLNRYTDLVPPWCSIEFAFKNATLINTKILPGVKLKEMDRSKKWGMKGVFRFGHQDLIEPHEKYLALDQKFPKVKSCPFESWSFKIQFRCKPSLNSSTQRFKKKTDRFLMKYAFFSILKYKKLFKI